MTKNLAGYVLGELLGRGGMGSVYTARQPSLGRTVAIKLLNPELERDPNMVERLHTEARAGSRVSHANVAGVIDFGIAEDGRSFLVMEQVMGERLATIVEREGPLSPRRACELVLQLLGALDAAHAAGVVHADVKCDNILVSIDREGREVATLIDFGIARLVEDLETDPVVTHLSGTPEYLAPEVIAGARPTTASDLYAAGIVLYELLTGSTPFRGGSTVEICQRHLAEDAIAPSLRRPEVDALFALDRVVARALAKDPARRHSSALVFAGVLTAAMPARDDLSRTTLGRAVTTAFSTEAPTQNLQVVPRRRLATGTGAHEPSPSERKRNAIGAAIVAGEPAAIATAYLELARSLVAARRNDLAALELEQAVDILTGGEGPTISKPPPSLWRVLLALSSIYAGMGDSAAALVAARNARIVAIRAHSPIGRDRARALLLRLEHGALRA